MSFPVAMEVGRLYEPIEAISIAAETIASTLVAGGPLPAETIISRFIGLRGAWSIAGSLDKEIPNWLFPNAGITWATGSSIPGASYQSNVPVWVKPTSELSGTLDTVYNISGSLSDGVIAGYNGLTVGMWAKISNWGGAEAGGLISKYRFAGNLKSWGLYHLDTPDEMRFTIWDQASTAASPVAAPEIALDEWHFIAGRFTKASEVALFIDGTWYKESTTAQAIKINLGAPLDIFSWDGANFLAGRMARPFLCAAAIPDELIELLYNTEVAAMSA